MPGRTRSRYMNDSRFNYLLERYINKEATREEEEELKSLVMTGQYQDHFREDLTRYMETLIGKSKELPAPVDANQLYEKILSRQRPPETSEKPTVPVWYWVRIAAMLVLFLGAGWWLFRSSPDAPPTLASVEENSGGEPVIHFTKKDFIKLPDGSTVLLNDDSELSYSLPFGDGPREVTLKGEAFFNIIHDHNKPFVVRTGNISTNVLGTAFNVNARNKNVVVTVERGLVQVADETQTLSLVRPDERLTVNTLTSNFEKTEVKATEEIAWKSKSIVFDDIPLREAADILQAHFGGHINIENPNIENCRINAWFLGNESLDEILEMVCGIRQADYNKKDSTITITGGIACEP